MTHNYGGNRPGAFAIPKRIATTLLSLGLLFPSIAGATNAAAPIFQTYVMTDAGVTAIDNALPVLDHSPRITQNRRQVDQSVRSNIVEFLDRLAAFTATPPYRTAQDLAAETAIER